MAAGASPGGKTVGRVNVRVLPDTSLFKQRLEAYLARVEAMTEVSVNLDLDTRRAQARLEELTRDREIDIRVDADTARARAQLAAITRDRHVTVHAHSNRRSLTQVGRVLGMTVRTALSSVYLAGSALAKVGAMALSGLGKAAGWVAGKLNEAAQWASQAFRTVSQALSKAGEKVDAFATVMGEMAANILVNSTNIPMLIVQMAMMSAMFGLVTWAAIALVGAIAALGSALVVIISSVIAILSLLAVMAAAMVGAAIAVAALAAAPLAVLGVGALIIAQNEKMKKSFASLKKKVSGIFTKAVQPLFTEFKKQIPLINRMLDNWAPELKRAFAAASKHLEVFIRGFMRGLTSLTSALADAMSTSGFARFAQSLAGLMNTVGQSLGRFFQILAVHGSKLAVVVNEIGNSVSMLLPSFARLLVALSSGAPAVGKFAEGAARLMDAMSPLLSVGLSSSGFAAFMQSISDGLAVLGKSVGTWFATATKHGAAFGDAFESMMELLARTATPMAELMADLAEVTPLVMGALSESFENLIPVLSKFLTAWAEASPEIIESITDAIIGLLNYFSRGEVVEAITELTQSFIDFFAEILNADVLDTLISISQLFAEMMGFLAPIVGHLLPYMLYLMVPLVTAYGILRSVVSALWDAILAFVSWCRDAWSSLAETTGHYWQVIKGWVVNAISTASDFVGSCISTIKGWWNGLKAQVLSIWSGIGDGIRRAMEGGKRWVSKAISAMTGAFEGLKNGVKAVLNTIIGWWNGLADHLKIPSWVPKVGGKGLPHITPFSADVKLRMAPGPSPFTMLAAAPLPTGDSFDTQPASQTAYRTSARLLRDVFGDRDRGVAPQPSPRTTTVNVTANTDANPYEIGREVAWALRTRAVV